MSETFKPAIHPKGWGREEWILNSDLYCGKILVFQKSKRCSWHFHKVKDETFHLLSGSISVFYSYMDDLSEANTVKLEIGESFHIPPGMRHQMIAHEDSKLLEISTTHFEEDSYRIVKGD